MIKIKIMWSNGAVDSHVCDTQNQLAFYLLGLGDVGIDAILITYTGSKSST